jgi:alpha-glucosidase
VDWETSRTIDGKIGDYVIVARKAKNSEDWFVGAITDEEARTFAVPLDFLTPGKRYVAEIYADGPGANWATNPLPVSISKRGVSSKTSLSLVLAPGGGQAIRITPAK